MVGLKNCKIPLGLLHTLSGLISRVEEYRRGGDIDAPLVEGDDIIALARAFVKLFLTFELLLSLSPYSLSLSRACAAIFALYLAIIAGQFKLNSGSQVDSSAV